jgi:uncharacterized protein with FMN-binding domain
MRRSSMILGGTALGAIGVMALPHQGKPQQVAIAGNVGATKARKHSRQPVSAPKPTTAPKASTAPTTETVNGALATDQYGQLRVRLTVKNGRITKVGFSTFVANDGNSMQIDQFAAPVLIRETIAAQSAHIQGVTGATYTSNAYQQSLQAAIDKAGLKA